MIDKKIIPTIEVALPVRKIVAKEINVIIKFNDLDIFMILNLLFEIESMKSIDEILARALAFPKKPLNLFSAEKPFSGNNKVNK